MTIRNQLSLITNMDLVVSDLLCYWSGLWRVSAPSSSYHANERCVDCEAEVPHWRPAEPHLAGDKNGDWTPGSTQHGVGDHPRDDVAISWVRHGTDWAAVEGQEPSYEDHRSESHQLQGRQKCFEGDLKLRGTFWFVQVAICYFPVVFDEKNCSAKVFTELISADPHKIIELREYSIRLCVVYLLERSGRQFPLSLNCRPGTQIFRVAVQGTVRRRTSRLHQASARVRNRRNPRTLTCWANRLQSTPSGI